MKKGNKLKKKNITCIKIYLSLKDIQHSDENYLAWKGKNIW